MYTIILTLIAAVLAFVNGLIIGMYFEIPITSKVFGKAYEHNRRCDELTFKNLSYDTQTILESYMRPINYRGKHLYVVDNIELFDMDLKEHSFYDLGYNCGERRDYCFDKYIRKHLETGEAFAIVINGKKYIAVMPMFDIDADCLVNGTEHRILDAAVQKI